jgi:hypothetical protein
MEQFYKAMKPLFYISRILGIIPYSLAAEGNLKVSVPAVVYSIIFNILMIPVPMYVRIRAWKHRDGSTTSVTFMGKNILMTATLFTCTLCASISLFRCRELINIFKQVSCLCTLTEELYVFHKRFTVIKLLLLGCVPFCIVYLIFCAMVDDPVFALLFMPFMFNVFYCPFLVVVQFAYLILLSKRSFSYINKCLGDILTKVSPPTRDNLITLSSLSSCIHRTNPEPTKVSSISLSSNKPTAGCSHMSVVSTSLSQIVSVHSRNLMSHINIDSTCLSSPKFTLGLRVQILSLINFHDELCVMVRNINSVYSLLILVNVAEAFICITVSLFLVYFLPTLPSRGQSSHLYIFMTCWGLIKLLVLLRACTSCTEEVSKYSVLS